MREETYLPPSRWLEWAKAHTGKRLGPQFGLEAMVRAFRHNGTMTIRLVDSERSVLAWRPDNPLLQSVLARAGRPLCRIGHGFLIPVGVSVVQVRAVNFRNPDRNHLVIERCHPTLWVGTGDPWEQQDETRA